MNVSNIDFNNKIVSPRREIALEGILKGISADAILPERGKCTFRG